MFILTLMSNYYLMFELRLGRFVYVFTIIPARLGWLDMNQEMYLEFFLLTLRI